MAAIANPLADAYAPRRAAEDRVLRALASWSDEALEQLAEIVEGWPEIHKVEERIAFLGRTA